MAQSLPSLLFVQFMISTAFIGGAELPQRIKAVDMEFVWIPSGGFYISSKESAAASGTPPTTDLWRAALKSEGLPDWWQAGLPDSDQWLAARSLGKELEINEMEGGRGEWLADGRIIGQAAGFPKSAVIAALPLSPKVRSSQTEEIDPNTKALRRESEFAWRIVLAPDPSKQPDPFASLGSFQRSSPGTPQRQDIGGVEFTRVEAANGQAFWITTEEIPEESESETREKVRQAHPGVRRATSEQWLQASRLAEPLSLKHFASGRGELLRDDQIIGVADAYEESEKLAKVPLKRSDRLERTKKTTIQRASLEDGSGSAGGSRFGAQQVVSRVVIHEEFSFATRLVIED